MGVTGELISLPLSNSYQEVLARLEPGNMALIPSLKEEMRGGRECEW